MSMFTRKPRAAADASDERARARMVDEIAAMARRTASLTGRERFSSAVMAAMAKVPRHLFVPVEETASAYGNHPLPIGNGQTISQPYIVALSTDLVRPLAHHRVLEVGTGSGYQAAILAELVSEVYSVEIVESLAVEATQRLQRLGYRNVRVRISDGHAGWAEAAPFDAIVVTAAAAEVPAKLVDQLRPGGRMVIPVGEPGRTQELVLVEKAADGQVSRRGILSVMFVPMIRG